MVAAEAQVHGIVNLEAVAKKNNRNFTQIII
jgi:hypothetical protein